MDGTTAQVFSFECEAVGHPKPDVYWTRDLKEIFVDSSTLQINISEFSGGKVFHCVAENRLGRDHVSVTYDLSISKSAANSILQDIIQELTDSRAIYDQSSGLFADMTKVIVDTINDVNIENRGELLKYAVITTNLIVEKSIGKFSTGTSQKITALLSSIVDGSYGIAPEINYKNVS